MYISSNSQAFRTLRGIGGVPWESCRNCGIIYYHHKILMFRYNSTDVADFKSDSGAPVNYLFGTIGEMPPQQVEFIGKLGANGIMGMGLGAVVTAPSTIESFTLSLTPLQCMKGISKMTLNGVDNSTYVNDFVNLQNPCDAKNENNLADYPSCKTVGYWNVNFLGMTTNDGKVKFGYETDGLSDALYFNASSPGANVGIFDSGTASFQMPAPILEKIYTAYGGNDAFNDAILSNNDIIWTFTFLSSTNETVNVTMPASYIIIDNTNFLQASSGNPLWTFGDLILQNFVTHFDYTTQSISIANPKTMECATTSLLGDCSNGNKMPLLQPLLLVTLLL
eukprot:Awhi_evm2s11578